MQPQSSRAEGAEFSNGEEADERIHASMSTPLVLLPPSRLVLTEYPQTYSRLVQRCFDDCVNDFTTKSLISREEGCVMRCVDKFLKGSERLGQRFQEQNAAMMQSGQLPGR